jgi:predicted PurR-regulated permease PerM
MTLVTQPLPNLPEQPVVSPEAGEAEEMPLPTDPRVLIEGGQFILLLLCVLYLAAAIVLPIVLAFILDLLLKPAMRLLARLRVPRTLGAFLIILVVFGAIAGLGTALSGPAREWAAKLPEGIPRLQERLKFLSQPIDAVRHFLEHAESYAQGDTPTTVAAPAQAAGLSAALFSGTANVASGFFTTMLLLFFLLVSSDTFLRRLVEVLPGFRNKRRAVEISLQIESHISVYLITITVMNAAVGMATALVMWLCGLGNPLLWGSVAFLLNYVPFLGPITALSVFLLAGLLSLDPLWKALLPAILYLIIHIVEGETVTPLLLARRFTLNPVVVVISLIFWYWMWGVFGAILAMPMLAITKIICDEVRPWAAFGRLLEGEEGPVK